MLDLRALDLRAGDGATFSIEVPRADMVIGGLDYELDVAGGHVTLDVNHAHTGWHLRVRGDGTLRGPCWRCLEPATVHLRADVSEFARFGRAPDEAFDEDLDSEYLTDAGLDGLGMARDALLDGVPAHILCSDGCAGLCPTCGASRNSGPCDCPPPPPDSRWDGLRELAERLRQDAGD